MRSRRDLHRRMTMHTHEAEECGVCKVPAFERNNYFHGKTLSARDLFARGLDLGVGVQTGLAWRSTSRHYAPSIEHSRSD